MCTYVQLNQFLRGTCILPNARAVNCCSWLLAGALAFEISSQRILLHCETLLKYRHSGYCCIIVKYCWNIFSVDIVALCNTFEISCGWICWNIVEILSWWILYHVEILLKYHPDGYCCTVKYCWNIVPVNILARDIWFAIANHSQKSRSQTVITNNHYLQLLSSLRHNSYESSLLSVCSQNHKYSWPGRFQNL